jgi:hypothetical protein
MEKKFTYSCSKPYIKAVFDLIQPTFGKKRPTSHYDIIGITVDSNITFKVRCLTKNLKEKFQVHISKHYTSNHRYFIKNDVVNVWPIAFCIFNFL